MKIYHRLTTSFILTASLLGAAMASAAPKAIHPADAEVPQLNHRQELNFSLDWQFIKAAEKTKSPPLADAKGWRKVDVPHDYSIEGPFIDKKGKVFGHESDADLGKFMGSRSTGYLPGGAAWYKKTFDVPADFKGKEVTILFDGVMMYTDVYLNGQHLGHHHYGYTPFYFDLTKHLKPGQKNEILVSTDNKLESRWYAGSGIYRPVHLIVTDPLRVAIWGTYITTPSIEGETATIVVETRLENAGKDAEVTVNTLILDASGKEVGKVSSKHQAGAGESAATQTLTLKNSKRWDLENPYLYTAKTEVLRGNNVIDDYLTPFGIRDIQISGDKGFVINGKGILLQGVNIHHDNGILGSKSFAWSEERKVKRLQEMGTNAIRFSHNPPSEAMLDACDRLGVLVIDEAFDEWRHAKAGGYAPYFDQWWEIDMRNMLLRDRNHPSIFAWSIGNEIPEQGIHPEGADTAKMLADFVRTLDKSRSVTHGIQPGGKTWGSCFPHADYFKELDLTGINYESGTRHKKTEEGLDEGGFKNGFEKHGRIGYQSESKNKNIFKEWQEIKATPYVIGDFVWTGVDYLGETGCGWEWLKSRFDKKTQKWKPVLQQKVAPFYQATCGDIDICGNFKPRAYYRKIVWTEAPIIFAGVRRQSIDLENGERITYSLSGWGGQPTVQSWTWDYKPGHEVLVDVYSGAEEIELFLNGKSLGKKKNSGSNEFKHEFKTTYQPGELKAIAYVGGKVVDEVVLKTAAETKVISAELDRKILKGNGMDVAYIDLAITDQEGTRNFLANDELTIDVQGAGTLIGIGTASYKASSEYPFTGNKIRVHEGRAQAVIRSANLSGEVIVTIKGAGLETVTKKITVQ